METEQLHYHENDHQADNNNFDTNQNFFVLSRIVIDGPKQQHTEAHCELCHPVVSFYHVVCFTYLQHR